MFDLSKPGVAVQPDHTFGGGWAWPLNKAGRDALFGFFGEPPAPIAPLGDRPAYIVEPNESGDLAEYLRGEGVAWKVVA